MPIKTGPKSGGGLNNELFSGRDGGMRWSNPRYSPIRGEEDQLMALLLQLLQSGALGNQGGQQAVPMPGVPVGGGELVQMPNPARGGMQAPPPEGGMAGARVGGGGPANLNPVPQDPRWAEFPRDFNPWGNKPFPQEPPAGDWLPPLNAPGQPIEQMPVPRGDSYLHGPLTMHGGVGESNAALWREAYGGNPEALGGLRNFSSTANGRDEAIRSANPDRQWPMHATEVDPKYLEDFRKKAYGGDYAFNHDSGRLFQMQPDPYLPGAAGKWVKTDESPYALRQQGANFAKGPSGTMKFVPDKGKGPPVVAKGGEKLEFRNNSKEAGRSAAKRAENLPVPPAGPNFLDALAAIFAAPNMDMAGGQLAAMGGVPSYQQGPVDAAMMGGMAAGAMPAMAMGGLGAPMGAMMGGAMGAAMGGMGAMPGMPPGMMAGGPGAIPLGMPMEEAGW